MMMGKQAQQNFIIDDDRLKVIGLIIVNALHGRCSFHETQDLDGLPITVLMFM